MVGDPLLPKAAFSRITMCRLRARRFGKKAMRRAGNTITLEKRGAMMRKVVAILVLAAAGVLAWSGASDAIIGIPSYCHPHAACGGYCIESDSDGNCTKCGRRFRRFSPLYCRYIGSYLTTPATVITPDQLAILKAHNKYRDKHCVPRFQWSADLQKQAEIWAAGCHKDSTGNFCHQNDCGTKTDNGENLSAGWKESNGSAVLPGRTADEAADGWYCEIQAYSFTSPKLVTGTTSGCTPVNAHFHPDGVEGELADRLRTGNLLDQLDQRPQARDTVGVQIRAGRQQPCDAGRERAEGLQVAGRRLPAGRQVMSSLRSNFALLAVDATTTSRARCSTHRSASRARAAKATRRLPLNLTPTVQQRSTSVRPSLRGLSGATGSGYRPRPARLGSLSCVSTACLSRSSRRTGGRVSSP
jgi:hypothetical protein